MIRILLCFVIFGNAAAAAVNPPVMINEDTVLATSSRKPVLIYYANETAPTPTELRNYEVLMSWLRESNTTIGEKIVHRWSEDLKRFPSTVDREQEAIRTLAASVGDDRLGVVLVTNRIVRRGYMEMKQPDTAWTKMPFQAAPSDNYILESNPLARPQTLAQVLAAVATEFPPTEYSFLLHVKSHGAITHVISTNIAKRHEDIDKDELISSLKQSDLVYRANGTFQEVDTARVGISKEDFFQALGAADKLGMKFPLIFLESCGSGIQMSGSASGIRNIGYLISSDLRGIGYKNVDFLTIDTSSDSGIFQSYYSQLSLDAKKAHQKEYGIELNLADSFLPTTVERAIHWLKRLL